MPVAPELRLRFRLSQCALQLPRPPPEARRVPLAVHRNAEFIESFAMFISFVPAVSVLARKGWRLFKTGAHPNLGLHLFGDCY